MNRLVPVLVLVLILLAFAAAAPAPAQTGVFQDAGKRAALMLGAAATAGSVGVAGTAEHEGRGAKQTDTLNDQYQ